MIRTKQELKDFLDKQPNKYQVKLELESLKKEISRLENVKTQYGKDNQRLSYQVKNKNNCWTNNVDYDNKEKSKFKHNQKQKEEITKQIDGLKAIEKAIKEYKPVEITQMKLDLKELNKRLEEALSVGEGEPGYSQSLLPPKSDVLINLETLDKRIE